MRFAALEHETVAIWGYGREGRSALAALRRRFPGKPLTLYCSPAEAAVVRAAVEPSGLPTEGGAGGPVDLQNLTVDIDPPVAQALASHTVVVKSPGISAYRPEVLAAQQWGTRFTSGTALWFGENPSARVVAVTGTKGKSTTTALVAHLTRALGVRTALAGNIGLPLLALDGQRADLWVVELSSFQTGEAGPVELGVFVSLGEDHLDWHGTRERYVADKLKLVDVSRTLLVDGNCALLMQRTAAHPRRKTFDVAAGWHAAGGTIWRRDAAVFPLRDAPLHGLHNAHNACAALAAVELLGLDASKAAPALSTFQPLPHRLASVGVRDGVEWIDDSIATTPDAVLAALESLRSRPVTVIVGGYERGLDWAGFGRGVRGLPPVAIVAQGAAGPRIAGALHGAGLRCPVEVVADLAAAVARARALTACGGVVLLSPGAPSFDQFRDYAERGRVFARLAGLGERGGGDIAGLGIA